MPHTGIALESATLAAKVFQGCCDVPILNFLKPAASLCVLICETAKTSADRKEAARDLSARSAEVMDLIVDHLLQTSLTKITSDLERDALRLNETLDMVNQHVKHLKNRKRLRNIYAWVSAKKDHDKLLKLKGQLSDALNLFGISRTLTLGRQVLETHQDVRLVLSRVDKIRSLPRIDEPRRIHAHYVKRNMELGQHEIRISGSETGNRQAVTAVRLYKATFYGPYGEPLPIIAKYYESGVDDNILQGVFELHEKMRNQYFAQVFGTSTCKHTLYFFGSHDCRSIEQAISQAGSDEEAERYFTNFFNMIEDISLYLFMLSPQDRPKVSRIMIPAGACVLQEDKVVLTEIPPFEDKSEPCNINEGAIAWFVSEGLFATVDVAKPGKYYKGRQLDPFLASRMVGLDYVSPCPAMPQRRSVSDALVWSRPSSDAPSFNLLCRRSCDFENQGLGQGVNPPYTRPIRISAQGSYWMVLLPIEPKRGDLH